MKKLPFILLTIVAVVIATATFVEDRQGTAYIMRTIYDTAWFRLLWVGVAASGAWLMWRQRLFKQFSVSLLHIAFLVILAGALTTALTARRGTLHLRQHLAETYMDIEHDGERTKFRLPFSIELDTFCVAYYQGTQAPSDYISQVTVRRDTAVIAAGRISMNRIMSVEGYRLYQSSFDSDERGTILAVNYDPYGIALTYTGYLLLALSVILLLVDRRQTFRRLLRHPALRNGLFVILLCCSCATTSATTPVSAVQREQAEAMKSRQVIYNDRIAPLNTLARDFCQKITGQHSFGGLTAEQVLLSWALCPEQWKDVKMIKVKSPALCRRLGVEGEYVSFQDLFAADGTYRLLAVLNDERGTHSKLEKAAIETDEKVGLILMLTQGSLIRPLPDDGSVPPLSATKVQAELLYNAIPFSKVLFMANLTLGMFFFGMLIRQLTRRRTANKRRTNGIYRCGTLLLLATFLFHTVGYGLRWYISGNVPLTNGYETMLFVALVTMLAALVMQHALPRFTALILPFGFLISGFTLLVSHLTQMNPHITSLMPVLQSPWLSSHVSLIMLSYSLFAFITLNACVALVLIRRGARRQLIAITTLSRLLLMPAVGSLAIGIFLGAVWANVSWGTYWSWDPKEVWALITLIAYGMAFHRHSLPWLRRPLAFHLYMIGCFLTVLMTYFGVNYLLGGMHSYAG